MVFNLFENNWGQNCSVTSNLTFLDSAHVGTLADKILLDPSREVEIVREVDEAHGEGPDVPLEDVLVCFLCFIFKKAANPSLS